MGTKANKRNVQRRSDILQDLQFIGKFNIRLNKEEPKQDVKGVLADAYRTLNEILG